MLLNSLPKKNIYKNTFKRASNEARQKQKPTNLEPWAAKN